MNEVTRDLRYEGKPVRTVEKDGVLWWVLVDVCNVLGVKNATQVAARLDEDERAMLDIGLGPRGAANCVNESGLYSVLLRSDKPEAKPFKRWVTHTVLPCIRMTGQYTSPQDKEKKRFLFADVPENPEAQKLMGEMDELTVAVRVMLGQYNCYRHEDERKGYADVITSICSRLFTKSSELGRVKHKIVERRY